MCWPLTVGNESGALTATLDLSVSRLLSTNTEICSSCFSERSPLPQLTPPERPRRSVAAAHGTSSATLSDYSGADLPPPALKYKAA